MKTIREKKMILDLALLMISCVWIGTAYMLKVQETAYRISAVAAAILCTVTIIDLIRLGRSEPEEEQAAADIRRQFGAQELILLNEEERPIKSWTLTGKTAMIIGRCQKDEEVDVDLSDCEYGAMIDVQHAVLNYCLDDWYLEDLGSHNGVKVKKVEDGVCYRMAGSRPCKIIPGDVIYIAKTKLLLT